MSIRVVLGEDSFLASEGIARVIEQADGIDLVASHRDFDSLTDAIDELEPDVVVTDIRMPPTHTDEGIRLAGELQSAHPETGVVVLSQHSEPVYATSLLQHGTAFRAYLLKEHVADAETLAGVIRIVAEGGSYVDPTVVEALVRSAQVRAQSQLDLLTPRELEILGLIAEGQSNSSIASTLFLTKRAVERHINSIFTKLDLGNPEDISRRVKAALLYLSGDAG